ncbi:MAG: transposase [Verrucomicrobiota bacterium]|nr:transposase [Verrucomicrobiota bacterium]
MSRGDRREDIFKDESDRLEFLRLLGAACVKTGWQVHAYCLMTNHFHAVVETPQANLAAGMRWFLGSYTQGFNHRHRQWGHLFGGRYKAQLVDERGRNYLLQACNYVHLNPKRAGLIGPRARLESYRWSSYPAYLQRSLRPKWLRVDRLLGEHGLASDSARNRREFSGRMEAICPVDLAGEDQPLRRGWKLGGTDFAEHLAQKLGRRGRAGERASERRETDAALAESMVGAALAAVGWRELDLARQSKGHPVKIEIARQLRKQTPMHRQWIADRLTMGSASYVSNLLASVDS